MNVSNNILLLKIFIVRDNTCTKVTCKFIINPLGTCLKFLFDIEDKLLH